MKRWTGKQVAPADEHGCHHRKGGPKDSLIAVKDTVQTGVHVDKPDPRVRYPSWADTKVENERAITMWSMTEKTRTEGNSSPAQQILENLRVKPSGFTQAAKGEG